MLATETLLIRNSNIDLAVKKLMNSKAHRAEDFVAFFETASEHRNPPMN